LCPATGRDSPGSGVRTFPRNASVVLVRGDAENPEIDRTQALDFFDRYPNWGRFGLSAYYAEDDAAIDDLASDLLERFEALLVYPLAGLVDAGFEVVATFRKPHVTIAFHDIDQGLAHLAEAEHEVRSNPYHGKERRTP
jgi:hypothetical protein